MVKIERLIKLAAYLLDSDRPVTLERLRDTVYSEYDNGCEDSDALRRMFERDKDELREIGIEIAVVHDESEDVPGYIVYSNDYYLPPVELLPEERVGINIVSRLFLGKGTPFSALANSALLKLEFDDAPEEIEEVFPVFHWVSSREDGRMLNAVLDGITRRKTIKFSYRSLNADEPSGRIVSPYGLFNREGAWYVVGLCKYRGEVRSFKFDRIESKVEVNSKNPHKPDYEVPPDFDLRKEACWEWPLALGEEDVKACVRFKEPLASSFSGTGMMIDDVSVKSDGCVEVTYIVGDPEEFVNWIFEFGENARILYPEELVKMARRLLWEVLEAVGGDD